MSVLPEQPQPNQNFRRLTDPAYRLQQAMTRNRTFASVEVVRRQPQLVVATPETALEGEPFPMVIEGLVVLTQLPPPEKPTPMTRVEVYQLLQQPDILAALECVPHTTIKAVFRAMDLLYTRQDLVGNDHLRALVNNYDRVKEALIYMRDCELTSRASDPNMTDLDRVLLWVKNLNVSSDTKTAEQLLAGKVPTIFGTDNLAVMSAALRSFAF